MEHLHGRDIEFGLHYGAEDVAEVLLLDRVRLDDAASRVLDLRRGGGGLLLMPWGKKKQASLTASSGVSAAWKPLEALSKP